MAVVSCSAVRRLLTVLLVAQEQLDAPPAAAHADDAAHVLCCMVVWLCCAACLRTGRWLSCFGRRVKSREAQILERLKVLDDIVSDSGAWRKVEDHAWWQAAAASCQVITAS